MAPTAQALKVVVRIIKGVAVDVVHFIGWRYPARLSAMPTKRLNFKLVFSDLAPPGAVGFVLPVFLPGINRAIPLPGQLSAPW